MLRKTLFGVTSLIGFLLVVSTGVAQAQDTAETAKSAEPAAEADQPPEAAPPTGEAAAPEAAGSGAQVVQLKALEQRVNELKERIFRSKARLNLLKETVLHGVIAGSRATIKHKNEMGSTFRLAKLVYAVDGKQVYSKAADDGSLDERDEFDVFNGSIVPGSHTVSVTMVFRGHGYGVFTYLKGYRFTVRASHTFTSAEGRQNVITVRSFEKGNATTELKDRPAIAFDTSLYNVRNKGAQK